MHNSHAPSTPPRLSSRGRVEGISDDPRVITAYEQVSVASTGQFQAPENVLIAVKYPSYRGLYDLVDHQPTILRRVYLLKPIKLIGYGDRRDLYALVQMDPVTFQYTLSPQGRTSEEQGINCFVFTDHRNRPVEFILCDPHRFLLRTETIDVPIGDAELMEAVYDLESIQDVADKYQTSVFSVIERVRRYNLSHPGELLYPTEEYIDNLMGSITRRELTLQQAAEQLGVTTTEFRAWSFWSR